MKAQQEMQCSIKPIMWKKEHVSRHLFARFILSVSYGQIVSWENV